MDLVIECAGAVRREVDDVVLKALAAKRGVLWDDAGHTQSGQVCWPVSDPRRTSQFSMPQSSWTVSPDWISDRAACLTSGVR